MHNPGQVWQWRACQGPASLQSEMQWTPEPYREARWAPELIRFPLQTLNQQTQSEQQRGKLADDAA